MNFKNTFIYRVLEKAFYVSSVTGFTKENMKALYNF